MWWLHSNTHSEYIEYGRCHNADGTGADLIMPDPHFRESIGNQTVTYLFNMSMDCYPRATHLIGSMIGMTIT